MVIEPTVGLAEQIWQSFGYINGPIPALSNCPSRDMQRAIVYARYDAAAIIAGSSIGLVALVVQDRGKRFPIAKMRYDLFLAPGLVCARAIV